MKGRFWKVVVGSKLCLALFTSYNTDKGEKPFEEKQDSPVETVYFIENPNEGIKSLDSLEVYLPYEEKLREIENTPYEKGINDCRHKAIEYHNFLKEKGIYSRVVEGWSDKNFGSHARVCVRNSENGKWYMADPTWKTGIDGLEVHEYGEWHNKFVYLENVTPDDLATPRRNISKKIQSNVELQDSLLKVQNAEKN